MKKIYILIKSDAQNVNDKIIARHNQPMILHSGLKRNGYRYDYVIEYVKA